VNNDANAKPSPSSNASQSSPSQLTEAAKQLAARMSRDREGAPQPTNGTATATESQTANIDPQRTVPVDLMSVDVLDESVLDGKWGNLREQSSEDNIESGRPPVAANYRDQVEAYFQSLSQESRDVSSQ
jgi:hypothetical protein